MAEYQKVQYILVDEYQDKLLKRTGQLLAGSHKNICVVGDDDQSILQVPGAAISNILKFKEDYSKVKQVVLTTNYRSTQSLLDTSYRLIDLMIPIG